MADIELVGLDEYQARLDKIATSNPGFDKRLRAAIAHILKDAQKDLIGGAKEGLGMNGDPRHAAQAIRYTVYRKIFGGNLNILQKQKGGAKSSYTPDRHPSSGRGGNRWGRNSRTIEIDGYEGASRGFILRFLNQGTKPRFIHSYTANDGERHNLINPKKGGKRENIDGRDWFGSKTRATLESAETKLNQLLNDAINELFI